MEEVSASALAVPRFVGGVLDERLGDLCAPVTNALAGTTDEAFQELPLEWT